MISILDLGLSNLGSLVEAFSKIRVQSSIVSNPRDLINAKAIILPGVGAFADGMKSLEKKGFIQPLIEKVSNGIPILGICLGMQLLAESSEEFGINKGLGLIEGKVVKLPKVDYLPLPNMGWCDLYNNNNSKITNNISDGDSFYFVHSYHLICSQSSTQTSFINYGTHKVTAIVENKNIFGAQFHPEKSHDKGLNLLSNFVNISKIER